jgi:hypothetical protein
MVIGCHIPLRGGKLSIQDFSDIVKNSQFEWTATNEKYTCFLLSRIERNGKKICISLWQSGWFQMMGGVLSKKEGEQIYQFVLKDLKQNCKAIGGE